MAVTVNSTARVAAGRNPIPATTAVTGIPRQPNVVQLYGTGSLGQRVM
jgi:hypothetical protein